VTPRQGDTTVPAATTEVESHTPLPRLTRRVFHDLAIWMVGLGLLTGLVFPPFVLLLGLPAERVLEPTFFSATLGAGLLVGALNFWLARSVVGARLELLRGRMAEIEETVRRVVELGDASGCDPDACRMQVDSDDELGAVAEAFNALVEALAASHRVNDVDRRMGALLAAHLDLTILAREVLQELGRSFEAEASALCLERDGELVAVAAQGLVDADSVATSDPVRVAYREGRTLRIAVPSDLLVDAGVTHFRPRSVLVLPLELRGVRLGALLVASSKEIDEESERLLGRLLPHMAVAIHNALGHERLQRVAARDALTGVYNRRYGMERLAKEFERAVRSSEPLGLLLFDIDRFKAINDSHGHLVGDRVLVSVARCAQRSLREGDVLVRYGGEEFLAILPGAGHADISVIGERIRSIVSEERIEAPMPQVTVSVGGASYPAVTAADVDELLRAADQALYLAKAAGRDRVVMADPVLRAAS
jgi:two-component system cell cycle response regulator